MKRIYWIFAVAVTIFALSFNTFAQPPGGGQGRGQGMGPGGGVGPQGMGFGMGAGAGGIGAVLQNPELARVLELSPQQATELQGIMRESIERLRTEGQNIQRPQPGENPEEIRQFMEGMRQRVDTGMGEVQARVDQVLRPEQRTRLRDVTFQLSGGLESPMLSERTLATLDLTDTQREQVRRLAEARNARIGEINWRDQAERERFQSDFAQQVRGLLTAEQRAKAERLTAEAPALRERLGMPAQGARGQQGQQGRTQTPGGGFIPGQGAWQPGRDVPTPAAPSGQQRRAFPRGEN
jgi:Spy/CpxP family protein refolding chaperone